MHSGRTGLLAAFLVALAVLSAQMALKRADRLQPDERGYLSVVAHLVSNGVFTDGDMTADGVAGKPGRFFTPAYPLLIAGLTRIDGGFARALQCHRQDGKALRTGCGPMWSFFAAQVVLAAIGMAAVFVTAQLIAGSNLVAWGTLLVALATGESAIYARLMLTDTLAFTAIYVCVAALVALVQQGRSWQAALAGAAIGLATLSRPGYIYLLYATAVVIPVVALLWPRATASDWWHGIAVLAAGGAVLAPWMLRNYLQFGDVALTSGYGPFTLVQRVAYNAMSWPEWAAAWIYWLPDVGDDLAKVLFKPELTAKLGFVAPDTYYKVGAGKLMTDTLAAAGGPDQHLPYLIQTYVLGDLVKHCAVTLVLAWRGFWAGKWLGVIALALCWPVVRDLVRQGKGVSLLALTLPLLFMLGLHAFVSVNVVRYNVPLIAVFALIVAYAANSAWSQWRDQRSGRTA